MKNIFYVLTALIMLPGVSFATELTLTNGATYKDIKVTQTTPLGIDFLCNDTAGWADFRDMPLDEAKSFGYDPMKSAAFEKNLQDNQGSTLNENSSPQNYIPQSAMNNPDNVSQTPENTIVVNPGDSVPYDTSIVYGGGSPQWVVWNGNRYPYNEWHNWYWNNHWVYSNGRYVPSNYYHHQYMNHNGRYYPYKHNLQPKPDNPHRTNRRNDNNNQFEHRHDGGIQRGNPQHGHVNTPAERGGEQRGNTAPAERSTGGGHSGGGGRR